MWLINLKLNSLRKYFTIYIYIKEVLFTIVKKKKKRSHCIR